MFKKRWAVEFTVIQQTWSKSFANGEPKIEHKQARNYYWLKCNAAKWYEKFCYGNTEGLIKLIDLKTNEYRFDDKGISGETEGWTK